MASTTHKMVLFRVGKRQYGINMPHVKNIQSVDEISESMKVPRFDLSHLFSENSSGDDKQNKKLILVDQKDQQLALIVDGVDGVVNAEDNQIVPLPPVFEGHSRECFPWIFNHKDRIILLVNPVSIIDAEDMIPTPVFHEPDPEPLEGLVDLEGEEIDSSILDEDDTTAPALQSEPEPKLVIDQIEPDTEDDIPELMGMDASLDEVDSVASDPLQDNASKPDDKENPNPESTIEQSINVKKIEQILTRVVKEKVSGKLKNIFDEALMEPRLRT